ncbi:hypothetical protein [Shigella flexneri]|uniref:hypothetical protein n=1 Tax=Shigella flexneri TaxID=623 RepID=UPI00403E6AC2
MLVPTHWAAVPGSHAGKICHSTTHMAWSDADNQQVKLSMPELEELAAAMVQAQGRSQR